MLRAYLAGAYGTRLKLRRNGSFGGAYGLARVIRCHSTSTSTHTHCALRPNFFFEMKSNAIKDTEPHGLWRSLSSFSGSVWGVDFSGYVYRAMQACDGWYDHATGEITHDYANCNEWIAGRMESLVGNNVRPLLVWDGCALKSKGDHAAAERAEKREIAETKLAAFIDVGGDLESEAQ